MARSAFMTVSVGCFIQMMLFWEPSVEAKTDRNLDRLQIPRLPGSTSILRVHQAPWRLLLPVTQAHPLDSR